LASIDDFLLLVYGLKFVKNLSDEEVKEVLNEKLTTNQKKVSLLNESLILAKPKLDAIKFLIFS